jgi:hypothetical protein
VATVTFTYSYSLSGGRGQHLLLRMSRAALHIGDCLAALLRTCSPGSPSCGPLGRASPASQSTPLHGVFTGAWGLALFYLLRGERTLCRALMPSSSVPATL